MLGFFTALLAVASSAQWYMMLEANRDTRQMFQATQRPFMGTRSDGATYLEGWRIANDKPDHYNLGLRLLNSGGSIAIIKKYQLFKCISPCSGDDRHDLSQTAFSINDYVGPKSSYSISSNEITYDDLDAVAKGQKKLSLILYLEYADALDSGKAYHFSLCIEVLVRPRVDLSVIPPPNTKFDDLFESQICDSNNFSD